METAKDKICPMSGKLCMKEQCAWWCKFAQDCSVPLLAGMFADSTICCNVFEDPEYEVVDLK